MVPVNLSTIARTINERPEARRLFLLCEGINTEPTFLEKVLSNASYIDNPNVSFIKVNKTEKDQGVTNLDGLIRLAHCIIKDKSNKFDKKLDKIILFFDLDVYGRTNSEKYILNTINKEKDNIIFVFTNPAIELFYYCVVRTTLTNRLLNQIWKQS